MSAPNCPAPTLDEVLRLFHDANPLVRSPRVRWYNRPRWSFNRMPTTACPGAWVATVLCADGVGPVRSVSVLKDAEGTMIR